MKAKIVMVFDDNEYVYGTYPFNTSLEKDKVNELAMNVREERDIDVYVEEIEM